MDANIKVSSEDEYRRGDDKNMNKTELNVEMLRYGDTGHALATVLGITDSTLSNKKNGTSEFTQGEIATIKERYNLSNDRVIEIFFASDVS